MARLNLAERQKREAILRDTVQSLNRGTPDDVLLRKIITQHRYSISGARNILSEAKLFMEEKTA